MRIFKKKDGSPSGFAKILKGVGKAVGKVAPLLPVPGAGIIGKVLDTVTAKTGINVAAAAPAQSETVGDFANRVLKGVGGAAAGFTEQVATAPEISKTAGSSPFQVTEAMKQGFVQNKYGKYILWAAVAAGALALLKVLKIIK